jgi:hypothetical protein
MSVNHKNSKGDEGVAWRNNSSENLMKKHGLYFVTIVFSFLICNYILTKSYVFKNELEVEKKKK